MAAPRKLPTPPLSPDELVGEHWMAALFPSPRAAERGTGLTRGELFKPQHCGQSGYWGCVSRGCCLLVCYSRERGHPPSNPQQEDIRKVSILGSCDSVLKSGLMRLPRFWTPVSKRFLAHCRDPYFPSFQ